jgi:hypothetical protein
MVSAFSLVSDDMLVDYKACMGITRALSEQTDENSNHVLTMNVLKTRLEHLGHHIENVLKIIGPRKIVKKRKNLKKIIRKGTDSLQGNIDANIDIIQKNKIPHILIDEERMIFAFAWLLQAMVQQKNDFRNLQIVIARKHNVVSVLIQRNDERVSERARTSFVDTMEKEQDYNWTLAVAIIRMHGGAIRKICHNGAIESININFPIHDITKSYE